MSEETDAGLRKGHEILDALQLTPAEKAFAWTQVTDILEKPTQAWLEERRKNPALRGIALAAVFAVALAQMEGFAQTVEKLAREHDGGAGE